MELTWEGKHLPARPLRLPKSPKLLQSYGLEDAALNRLYQGENLAILGELTRDFTSKIDCIYIDPPFNSRANYYARIRLHGTSGKTLAAKQYEDRWSESEYLQFMYERLAVLRDLLADTGSIFIHCDWHAAAALRMVGDEIFGPRNLLNEIVWVYGSGGGSTRRFGRKHDTILFYARRAGHHFFNPDAVRVPYRAVIAQKRRALFHEQGMVAPDVWDIPRPPNHARTWVGYPTQKPLALVERALCAACPQGGTVLDCFAGSGTTLVAASRQGMHFIGVERADLGLHLARKRLVAAEASFGVYALPGTERNPGASRHESFTTLQAALDALGQTDLESSLRDASLATGDTRELIDWVGLDTNFDGRVFSPQIIDSPDREDLVDLSLRVPPTEGQSLVMFSDVTGRDHFARLAV